MQRQLSAAPAVTIHSSSFRAHVESLMAAGICTIADLAKLPRQPFKRDGKWVSL